MQSVFALAAHCQRNGGNHILKEKYVLDKKKKKEMWEFYNQTFIFLLPKNPGSTTYIVQL